MSTLPVIVMPIKLGVNLSHHSHFELLLLDHELSHSVKEYVVKLHDKKLRQKAHVESHLVIFRLKVGACLALNLMHYKR